MDTTKTNTSNETKEEKSLKGTFASVMVVAGVIVVMWIGVFWLYMERV